MEPNLKKDANPYSAPCVDQGNSLTSLPRRSLVPGIAAGVTSAVLCSSKSPFILLLAGPVFGGAIYVAGTSVEKSSRFGLASILLLSTVGYFLMGMSSMGVENYGVARTYGSWTIGLISGTIGCIPLFVSYSMAFKSCRRVSFIVPATICGVVSAAILTSSGMSIFGLTRDSLVALVHFVWQATTCVLVTYIHSFVHSQDAQTIER